MKTTITRHAQEKVLAPKPQTSHFRLPPERPFLYEERPFTTVLIGGLSPAHDYLVEATFQGLGLKAKALAPPNMDAFHYGREYGSNGFCNPAYFTIGNLIRKLKELEESGIPREEIVENYIFFTAACAGPCRFGMYKSEYRMALKDSGFEGFRVLDFQNEGGLMQKSKGGGLPIDPEFFLAAINTINLGDLVNELANASRPYEVVKGKTDEVKQKVLEYLYEKLRNKKRVIFSGPKKAFYQALKIEDPALFIARIWDQITSRYYTDALREVKNMFEEVEVDYFRSKTVVKVIGEFWAITSVGPGNFNMYAFLEKEGAVAITEPVAALVQFLLRKAVLRLRVRKEVMLRKNAKQWWQVGRRLLNYLNYQKKINIVHLGTFLFRREYHRLLNALGGVNHKLLRHPMLEAIASPYYNINLEGSEGYMEISKNVYYHKNHLAHMVMSLKPFGCMPSTQSDGVQAAIIEDHKEIIFLPLETAGEGETNAHSRVLMSLGDARTKTKLEYKKAKETVRSSMEKMRAFVEAHPNLKRPTYVFPKRNGIVNKAANFIYHVDELIHNTPIA